MGKLVVSAMISIDGVIEDPGGAEAFERGGWAVRYDQGPEAMQLKFQEPIDAEALLLGRVTYEGFAKAWPTRRAPGRSASA
jgi:dihydrofolate reductase